MDDRGQDSVMELNNNVVRWCSPPQQGATGCDEACSYELYLAPGPGQQRRSTAFLPAAQDIIQFYFVPFSAPLLQCTVADFGLAVKMESQDTHISAFQVRADRPWQLQC